MLLDLQLLHAPLHNAFAAAWRDVRRHVTLIRRTAASVAVTAATAVMMATLAAPRPRAALARDAFGVDDSDGHAAWLLSSKTTAAAVAGERRALETRLPAAERVIAIGDVHGDMRALRSCLLMAGVVDADGAWVGGDTVVVQLGDYFDRGDDERDVLHYLDELDERARLAGGAVHRLLGNHEIMNVDADFRYVTHGGFAAFHRRDRELAGDSVRRAARAMSPERRAFVQRLPRMMRDRAVAMAPGAPTARKLAERGRIALAVGDTLFVHGGLTPEHVDYGMERMNAETASWLAQGVAHEESGAGRRRRHQVDGGDNVDDNRAGVLASASEEETKTKTKNKTKKKRQRPASRKPVFLRGAGSPIWMRHYSSPHLRANSHECRMLRDTLQRAGARRMVVGHTPQAAINGACGGRVWRVDTGMAAAYGGAPEVLEITRKHGVSVIHTRACSVKASERLLRD